jgi:hypothetical protein
MPACAAQKQSAETEAPSNGENPKHGAQFYIPVVTSYSVNLLLQQNYCFLLYSPLTVFDLQFYFDCSVLLL